MFARRLPRRLTAWLAALAVLWGSLLPALSHAVVAHTVAGQGWVEVCTVSGMAWVRQAPDGSVLSVADQPTPGAHPSGPTDPSDPASSTMANCGWCATHAPVPGLPGVPALAVLPATGHVPLPPAFWHAPRLLPVWASAQSRAPPSLA